MALSQWPKPFADLCIKAEVFFKRIGRCVCELVRVKGLSRARDCSGKPAAVLTLGGFGRPWILAARTCSVKPGPLAGAPKGFNTLLFSCIWFRCCGRFGHLLQMRGSLFGRLSGAGRGRQK